MTSERLSENDINRLRGVVGLGTINSKDLPPTPNLAPKKEQPFMPRPVNVRKEETPVNNFIEPVETKPKKEKTTNPDAELFVKIEEHTEIAQELIDAKKDIKSIADTISLLAKAENLKKEAIERLENHLNTLDDKLADVENKLVEPLGMEFEGDGFELGPASDVSDLHKTLENLKNQLDHME